MCVIAVCSDSRLSDKQVEQMYDANSRGGGVAFRDITTPAEIQKDCLLQQALRRDGFDWQSLPEDTEISIVRWSKGHNKEKMVELNRELPFPYILHFRVPSGGTNQTQMSCHPFAVNHDATTDYSGVTTGQVLFHNGFWQGWKEKMQTIAMTGHHWVPSGPWSDSRGLAWAASHLGLGFLELVDEKVVTFGPGDYDIELFGYWQSIETPDPTGKMKTVDVSNKGWEVTTPVVTYHNQHHGKGRNQDKSHSGTVNDKRNPQLALIASGAVDTRTMNDGQSGGTAALDAASFRGGDAETLAAVDSTGNREEQVPTAGQAARSTTGGNHGRVVGSAGSLRLKCDKCAKYTAKGLPAGNKFKCYQCWSEQERQNSPTNPAKLLVGTCQTCKVTQCGSKRCEDDAWICAACWDVTGHPETYYMTNRRVVPPPTVEELAVAQGWPGGMD